MNTYKNDTDIATGRHAKLPNTKWQNTKTCIVPRAPRHKLSKYNIAHACHCNNAHAALHTSRRRLSMDGTFRTPNGPKTQPLKYWT